MSIIFTIRNLIGEITLEWNKSKFLSRSDNEFHKLIEIRPRDFVIIFVDRNNNMTI
jgi:hypothetical protein